jgi:tRNA (guanine-N7-)-methyltransferase
MRDFDMVRVKSASTDRLFQQHDPSAAPAPDAGGLAPLPASEIELVPGNYFALLDPATVFSRPAPLEVDLGCGNGAFLVAMAEKYPERNFLGIERLEGRVRSACGRASRHNVRNLRVLRVETSYAVEYLLPAGSIAAAHLLFPDPWPKKRHEQRRIVTKDFLAAVHRLLVPDGSFRIATDRADYFAVIRELIAHSAFLEEPATQEEAFPLTTFEKRFLADGAPIYRLLLRKTV